MPDLEDLLGEAADGRERSLAALSPRAEHLAATVTRVRRRRALRRGVQVAAVMPVAAALGLGAWALSGRPAPEPVATPTTSTSSAPAPTPTPTPTPTATPTPTPTSTPTPTGPALTDAITSVDQRDLQWQRLGGLVPVDAPFGTFPAPAGAADPSANQCTPEQVAWLETYGVARSEGISAQVVQPRPTAGGAPGTMLPEHFYTLTNTSSAPVTVQNIRIEGTSTAPAAKRVWVGCLIGGIGGDANDYFAVATPGAGAPATLAVNPYGPGSGSDRPTPVGEAGSPFATTIAPGASYLLPVVPDGIDPTLDFRGRIVADVVIDGTTFVTVIDPDLRILGRADEADVVAAAGYQRLFCFPDLPTAEDVKSMTYAEAAPYACTLDELAARVAVAAGQ